MFQINNFLDNQNMRVIAQRGPFRVFEHQKDLSVTPSEAVSAYYAEKMNARKRQLFVEIGKTGTVMQAGAMQWMLGNVAMDTGVQGVGNFFGKMVGASVSGETAVKPHYYGSGVVMLEPTYKHILLMDVAEWGCLVLDDGLFLACEDTIQQRTVARSNFSSAVAMNGLYVKDAYTTDNGGDNDGDNFFDAEELAEKSIPELREFAKEHEIDLEGLTKKADILEAISKALGGSQTMMDIQK